MKNHKFKGSSARRTEINRAFFGLIIRNTIGFKSQSPLERLTTVIGSIPVFGVAEVAQLVEHRNDYWCTPIYPQNSTIKA